MGAAAVKSKGENRRTIPHDSPHDSSSAARRHAPKDVMSYRRNTCPSVFTAAAFTTSEKWSQPGSLSVDKWVTECGITVGFYSTIEKSEIMTAAGKYT